VASGLPLHLAHNFYRLLKELQKHCCCTAAPLHLLWIVLEASEVRIAITNWNLWVQVLQCTMPKSHLEVASALLLFLLCCFLVVLANARVT
jgi:hypothetical protein